MIRVGILTLSDKGSLGQREDLSGKYLKEYVLKQGWEVTAYQILPDEKELIKKTLIYWCDTLNLDLILTNGGTGVHPRDVTPDATQEVIEKDIPGLGEYIRYISFTKTPRAALSRGLAGIRKGTLIVNLPGSPKALEEIMPSLSDLLTHAIAKIKGDPSECARA